MGREDHARAGPALLALLQRGARWFSEELTERLAQAGVDPITPAHASVLAHLDDEAALSIAELARRAGVTRQTMHRAVTQLVDEGLLASKPGPGFPRSSLIELTAQVESVVTSRQESSATWKANWPIGWEPAHWRNCAKA